MKVMIILIAFVAVASASYLGGGGDNYGRVSGPLELGPPVETGTSNQYRNQDNYGNYDFGYDEQHTSGGSFRRERSDGYGGVVGSYGLNDADGRQRTVHYIADAAGFRASIETNEPGIEPKDPASVIINKNGQNLGPVPIAAAGPVYGAAPIALPAPAAYGPGPIGHGARSVGYGASNIYKS